MKCKSLVALGVLTTLCLPLFGGNDTTTYLELKEDREEEKGNPSFTVQSTTPTNDVKKNKKKKRIYTILKAGVYIFLIAGGAIDLSNIYNNINLDSSSTPLPWNATLPNPTSNCKYSYHAKELMCDQNSFKPVETKDPTGDSCYILEKCYEVSYEQPQISLSISSLVLRGITFGGTLVYDWFS